MISPYFFITGIALSSTSPDAWASRGGTQDQDGCSDSAATAAASTAAEVETAAGVVSVDLSLASPVVPENNLTADNLADMLQLNTGYPAAVRNARVDTDCGHRAAEETAEEEEEEEEV
jgi:hypothetical protein